MKASGPIAVQLMAQGLYIHSTIPLSEKEDEMQEMPRKTASST
ncbi:unnamed protein product [Acanthoscelides obtectus]|uniref:Homeobox engrailed C-terminal domain-containing protein n=1 Tax=Acanthoscelides obtectus TaxID=200917 RepID=A0A9P0PB96_ACAOB|nr:unnamed protein product [Acanthoscelides obtectus]CAK1641709.1 hypothetical protein AOBTE_LOCUS12572 [Acanthoscelides obtectus]